MMLTDSGCSLRQYSSSRGQETSGTSNPSLACSQAARAGKRQGGGNKPRAFSSSFSSIDPRTPRRVASSSAAGSRAPSGARKKSGPSASLLRPPRSVLCQWPSLIHCGSSASRSARARAISSCKDDAARAGMAHASSDPSTSAFNIQSSSSQLAAGQSLAAQRGEDGVRHLTRGCRSAGEDARIVLLQGAPHRARIAAAGQHRQVFHRLALPARDVLGESLAVGFGEGLDARQAAAGVDAVRSAGGDAEGLAAEGPVGGGGEDLNDAFLVAEDHRAQPAARCPVLVCHRCRAQTQQPRYDEHLAHVVLPSRVHVGTTTSAYLYVSRSSTNPSMTARAMGW